MILPRDQFYRILQASRVQTKEEKLAELERLKREKEAALVSCGVFIVHMHACMRGCVCMHMSACI